LNVGQKRPERSCLFFLPTIFFLFSQLSKSEGLTTAPRRRRVRINANLILYLGHISDCLYLSCNSLKETASTSCFSIQWRE